MTEPLTAEELAEDVAEMVMVPGEKYRKLLAAAEGAQRLHAAIQKHKKERLRQTGTLTAADIDLWETLK